MHPFSKHDDQHTFVGFLWRQWLVWQQGSVESPKLIIKNPTTQWRTLSINFIPHASVTTPDLADSVGLHSQTLFELHGHLGALGGRSEGVACAEPEMQTTDHVVASKTNRWLTGRLTSSILPTSFYSRLRTFSYRTVNAVS